MTKTIPLLSLCALLSLTAAAADNSAAASLYLSKCASCHGKHGESKALNTSRPIATLSEAQIETALNGYKDGSYGGKLKKVKQGIVRNLNEADIKALAAYVTTLKTDK